MEPAAPQTFDWTWIVVSAPFAAAAVALAAGRYSERFAALLLLLVPLGDFYFFGVLLPPLSTGSVIFGSAAWLNAFGVEFTYAIDSLAVLFLLPLHFAVAAAMLAVAAGSTVCRHRTRGGASATAVPPVAGGIGNGSAGAGLTCSVRTSAIERPACCSAKA